MLAFVQGSQLDRKAHLLRPHSVDHPVDAPTMEVSSTAQQANKRIRKVLKGVPAFWERVQRAARLVQASQHRRAGFQAYSFTGSCFQVATASWSPGSCASL